MATTHARSTSQAPVERTEHPHVVKSEGILGGKARIDGTRISVYFIWKQLRIGDSVDDVLATYPWLTPAQIHDAISYAYDHPEEIADTADGMRLRAILKEGNLVYRGGFLLRSDQAPPHGLPPETPTYTWQTLPPELDE